MINSPSHQASNGHGLKQLLKEWRTAVAGTQHLQPPFFDGPDIQLTHLTEKTDEVKPGACFVARVRAGSDGHPYIGKAIEKGARMILAQRSPLDLNLTIPDDVVYLQVADTAESLAWLAAAWEGFPSRLLITIGVTGTDGKTSTANLLFEILQTAGMKTGLLSTTRAMIGDVEELLELHVTTPEAPTVQHYLRRMVNAGLTHCVLESTSHGLEQHRVTAVDFDIAVVTNITHEHLDYHGNYKNYFAAKARLFKSLSSGEWGIEKESYRKENFSKTAVLNRDDQSFDGLKQIPASIQLSYGIHHQADVYATDIGYAAKATSFTLNFDERKFPEAINQPKSVNISSSLVGEFNIYNMLAAATVAHRLGIEPELIKKGVEVVDSIDGRMQRIDRGQPFLTIVDFAHTPNALEKAIKAAQRMTQGRIIALFGSAGKRDIEKRRLMAETSARQADLTILTAEDPRTESLDDILTMMADGCRRQGGVEGETFWRIPDRGQAIYFALSLANPEDLILICGKGHEQSMCFGTIEYPWDDRDATRTALDAFLQNSPMPDLGLPTFQP